MLATLPTLRSYAVPIIDQISVMLGDLKPVASNALLQCVDTILQACHASNCFSAIGHIIYNGSLFQKLLKVIIEGIEHSQVIVGYLMIINRLILCDPDMFVNSTMGQSPEYISVFVKCLVEKFDCMAQTKQRKMAGLAMAALVGTGNEAGLQFLDAIFVLVTSVAVELKGLTDNEYTKINLGLYSSPLKHEIKMTTINA
jgi:hypothetical protein